jgi:hypothetical protein
MSVLWYQFRNLVSPTWSPNFSDACNIVLAPLFTQSLQVILHLDMLINLTSKYANQTSARAATLSSLGTCVADSFALRIFSLVK